VSEWKLYKRKGVVEAKPYDPTTPSLEGVSVSSVDKPVRGGMICRNPYNSKDMWYVAPEFFQKHFEEVENKSDDS